jgi:hypothetical protein
LEHPIGTVAGQKNLNLRIKIALKLETFVNTVDTKIPETLKGVFEQFPRWKFYTNTSGDVLRMHGACEMKDGTHRLYMVSCMLGFNSDVVGGVPTEEVIPIDGWDGTQLRKISMSMNPALFLDPLGWLHIN